MVKIENRELPDSVALTLITVRQPGFFLPNFKKITAREISREERNLNHMVQGIASGVGFRDEVSTQGKELTHAGVCIDLDAKLSGKILSATIQNLHMEGQTIAIQDTKRMDKKIELRSTLHPVRRTRSSGFLTIEDLEKLSQTLSLNQVRAAKIWINPALKDSGETYYTANLMIGQFNPSQYPEHDDMPSLDGIKLLTPEGQIDLKAILDWKAKATA